MIHVDHEPNGNLWMNVWVTGKRKPIGRTSNNPKIITKKKEKKREIDNLVKGQLQAKIINFMVLFAVLLHKPKRNELHEKNAQSRILFVLKKGENNKQNGKRLKFWRKKTKIFKAIKTFNKTTI